VITARPFVGSLRSGDEGQSLIELALVLPMLMMTITFMFSIGMAMLSFVQLDSATSNAAIGQLAPDRDGAISSDPCAAIVTTVTSQLGSNFTAANLTYTVTITNSAGATVTYGPTTGSGFSCGAAYTTLHADTTHNNTPGSLTISYPYSWVPVIMKSMSGNLTATQPVAVY
jgi:Flp pilus assembly protein TadG